MATGAPDFFTYSQQSQWSSMGGLAELAARINGIPLIDRRGDVVWTDSFEYGVNKWRLGGTAIPKTFTQTTELVEHEQYAGNLTYTGGTNKYAYIIHPMSYLSNTKIGISAFITSPENPDYYQLGLTTAFLPDLLHNAVLRMTADGNLQVKTTDGTFQTIATGHEESSTTDAFLYLKIVCDPTTNKYTRAIFNNEEFDLSTIPLHTVASAAYPFMQIILQSGFNIANPISLYVDNVTLTINEP